MKSLLLPRLGSTQSTSSDNCHLICTDKGETRLVSIITQSFVLQLASSLQGYKVEFQQKVVGKMFIHDVMKPLLLTYLSKLQDAKHNHLIVESIKDGVFAHLARGHIAKHVTTKEFLNTLATSTRTSGKKVVEHLGLFKRCILNYKQQHFLIDDGDLNFQFGTTKKQHSNAFSPNVRDLVLD